MYNVLLLCQSSSNDPFFLLQAVEASKISKQAISKSCQHVTANADFQLKILYNITESPRKKHIVQ